MTTTHASGIGPGPDPEDASDWRQADKFALDHIVLMADDGQPDLLETRHGVALISQSCDVVLPHRSKLQVAPIVELSGENSRAARDGKRSQYAHLPQLGDDWFADLDHMSAVSKAALTGRRAGPGVEGDIAIRRFAGAVARRFGRFAFPDDVSDALKALRDMVQSKASKPQSPFGRILQDVLELRAESRDWSAVPAEVTLVFVVLPGALPTIPDDDPATLPPSVEQYLPDRNSARLKLGEIATTLTEHGYWTALERYWLWQLLAEAASLLCEAEAAKMLHNAHPTFTGEVVSADEFPLTRVRRSEIIDLDHLSTPTPLTAD